MTQHFFIKDLLIADDDHDDQLILQEVIAEFSTEIKTRCVSDGRQLMDALKNQPLPDLLFLDLNMPYKNGVQCLAELRQLERCKDLPVVVFSTSSNAKDISHCFDNGAQLFFSKPWGIDLYKELVHTILQTDWSSFKRPETERQFIDYATSWRGMLHD
jgi:CheY-like chemotaxis protein